MSVEYTEVKICNLALVKIGESQISDLNESSKKARHLKILFPLKRDDLLRSHPWGHARKRVQLARDVTNPISGYGAQFIIPDDCLRILEIDCSDRYSREGNRILTDASSVKLFYIFRNEDVNTWDASFVSLMATFLSVDLAWSIKGSRTLRADLQLEYQRDLALARNYSAQDSSPLYDMEYEGEGRVIANRVGKIEGY